MGSVDREGGGRRIREGGESGKTDGRMIKEGGIREGRG